MDLHQSAAGGVKGMLMRLLAWAFAWLARWIWPEAELLAALSVRCTEARFHTGSRTVELFFSVENRTPHAIELMSVQLVLIVGGAEIAHVEVGPRGSFAPDFAKGKFYVEADLGSERLAMVTANAGSVQLTLRGRKLVKSALGYAKDPDGERGPMIPVDRATVGQ